MICKDKRKLLAVSLIVFCLVVVILSLPKKPENLILNPDFALGATYWKQFHWPASNRLTTGTGCHRSSLQASPCLAIHLDFGMPNTARGVWQFIELQKHPTNSFHPDNSYIFYVSLYVTANTIGIIGSFKAYLDAQAFDGSYVYDAQMDFEINERQEKCLVLRSEKPLTYCAVFLLLSGDKGEVVIEKVELFYDRFELKQPNKLLDPSDNDNQKCIASSGGFQTHSAYEYRLFFQNASLFSGDGEYGVSVVTQMTIDRFSRLSILSSYWDGFISVAIYVRNEYDMKKLEELIMDDGHKHVRNNVDIHLLFADTNPHYPINVLRNLALDTARTKYIVSLDVDFLPSSGMHSYLRDMLQIYPLGDNEVFIIPSFEVDNLTPERIDLFPPDKLALLAEVAVGKARQVHVKFAPEAQGATNYSRWAAAEQPYEIEYESHYEPYIVGPQNMLRYDARFKGYGFDKASHTYEMSKQAYIFYVLPEVFVVHVDHEEQQWKLKKPDILTRVWMNIYEFMVEVERKDERFDTEAFLLQKFDFMDWADHANEFPVAPIVKTTKTRILLLLGVITIFILTKVLLVNIKRKPHTK